MMGDFRGFMDTAGVWRPMGRWRGGVWNDGRRRRPHRTRTHADHPLVGIVAGHGIISMSDGRRVTMASWSDAVQYDRGSPVTFGLSDGGQAVSVRGADKRTK